MTRSCEIDIKNVRAHDLNKKAVNPLDVLRHAVVSEDKIYNKNITKLFIILNYKILTYCEFYILLISYKVIFNFKIKKTLFIYHY